jgi:hypothetical protein
MVMSFGLDIFTADIPGRDDRDIITEMRAIKPAPVC